MIQVSGKHRMVGVPVHPQIASLFPNAPLTSYEGEQLAILPHNYDSTKLLRNIGFPVPAPILSQYNWSGGTPYQAQRNTAALMTTNHRCYVLNAFGTGKTKSAIWALDYLKRMGLAKSMLVLAPLSTLQFTWARELFMTC